MKFILVSDVIGGTDAVAINWTLDDAAASFISNTAAPASGTFKPTNYTVCQDPFVAPAPAGPYLSPGGVTGQTQCGTDTLAAFNGLNPNGTWSLYVVDDLGGDVGTITGGWAVNITTTTACATPTPTPTATPTPTPTPTPTVTPTPGCTNYDFTSGAGTLIPGVTRIDGVGCDDCTTAAPLPFSVSIYGTSYATAAVGSNGILAFGTAGNAFSGSCLPVAGATNQLMPFYRDQRTDCTGGCGIFTATTGSAPNRVFTVEYKTIYFGEASTTPTLDYEVNFYESGATAFDYTYGLINATTQTGRITSIGVQNNATLFRQFACDATGLTPPVTTGQRLSWTLGALRDTNPDAERIANENADTDADTYSLGISFTVRLTNNPV